MAGSLISKNAEPSGIKKCVIYGNSGNKIDLVVGIQYLDYYESILSDTVRVVIVYSDSKFTINGTTALDGLPIVGQEKVELEIIDNNDKSKKVTLYVNSATPNYVDFNKQLITLDLVSKEYILNEQVRVRKRYDGKISDSVQKILEDKPPFGLDTKKNLNIEQTVNVYNFIGNNKKPFYVCSWLSKKSIPSTGGGKGKTAGYFFYETDKGFFYKSIDTLMKQFPSAKLIYNLTSDERGNSIPRGYDGKILNFNIDVAANNMQKRMRMGLYNTRIIKFDPFNCLYEVINQQTNDTYEKGGKKLPMLNDKEFPNKQTNTHTKTSYVLVDTGTLPSGNTEQQISKSKQRNFEETEIMNNATMRYNNLFSTKISIQIAGKFDLSAGDTIFVDSPTVENSEEPDVNQQFGGKYLISDICHHLTATETITSMNLIRESVGRQS